MNGVRLGLTLILLQAWLLVAHADESLRIDAETYRDKCAGAWAGQMIGASYGTSFSFQSLNAPNTGELKPWQPAQIVNGLQRQELFIDTILLQALLDHGPAITSKEAGLAFARSKYEMSGANVFGRENVRLGILPPRSGNAKHTLHGEEIDFQMQADVLGIVAPGMPKESSRLCKVFGRIMCNGDGVHGGMFVAGMYAAAYVHNDVRAVVEAGLKCIPKDSPYRECISDVLAWHDEAPDDWRATWTQVQPKWNANANRDGHARPDLTARLNGAYATIALLFGDGDMARTLEIAVRCGQRCGSNASTAAGVLGCMRGFDALVPGWAPAFEEIRGTPFFSSDFTLRSAVTASETIAGQVVRRTGGNVEQDTFVIVVRGES
ncbi:MAG: ADP-ribosylglycohydrolase family protein [Candidatus Hydrogenedentales bacterium]|jgi:hypothetical protein